MRAYPRFGDNQEHARPALWHKSPFTIVEILICAKTFGKVAEGMVARIDHRADALIMTSSVNSLPMAALEHGPVTADSTREAGAGTLQARLLDADEWDRTISEFDGVCQEQLYAYASMRWRGLSLEPVLFSDETGPVGGALVMLQPLPLNLSTTALVKWGPILSNNKQAGARALRSAMTDYLIAEYADRRKMTLSIMPKVEPTADNRAFADLLDRGFRPGMSVRYPDRYVVDLTLDDEQRMAAFSQKWRYHLRKSLKAGLEFEHAPPTAIERFMSLYRAMSDRKLFPDYSAINGLDSLLAMPDGTARPELFFVTKDGVTVAGAVIFTAGDTATYLYGATNDDALKLRAGYFLHWHIIGWLRERSRAERYDLGGTDGFHGLHQFKSGMVGEAGFIAPIAPFADYASSARAKIVGSMAVAGYQTLRQARTRATELRLALARRFR